MEEWARTRAASSPQPRPAPGAPAAARAVQGEPAGSVQAVQGEPAGSAQAVPGGATARPRGLPGGGGSAAGGVRAAPADGAAPARGGHEHAQEGRRLPQRHSLRDQVLAALRRALAGAELQPGAVYSAPALAERFGVSATPVREAMQQLVREGAVEVIHNRGFRIAERSRRELEELGEVRALLEVPVVMQLARTVPGEHWAALRPLARTAVEAAARGDRAGYAEADRAFHRALIEPAGNGRLSAVAEELHRRSQCPPRPVPTAWLLEAATEHLRLLDALAAADLPTAEAVLRSHLAGPAG